MIVTDTVKLLVVGVILIAILQGIGLVPM